jgi:hypothetical protein
MQIVMKLILFAWSICCTPVSGCDDYVTDDDGDDIRYCDETVRTVTLVDHYKQEMHRLRTQLARLQPDDNPLALSESVAFQPTPRHRRKVCAFVVHAGLILPVRKCKMICF